MDVQVNDIYYPLLFNDSRYLVLLGGAGSGKSVFAAQKIIGRCLSEKHRFLIIRKVSDTLKDSVFKLITAILGEQGIFPLCDVNKTEKTILFPNGSEIIMKGLDDPEKIKSIAGITGIWIEESTEITDTDFDQLDLRLRGGTPYYKQIILTFNPIDERHWLKKRFFDAELENCTKLKTTYEDNFFIDEEYKGVLDTKAAASPNFYRIYKLGEWGKAEVQRPYAENFVLGKHTAEIKKKEGIPIILSFDFNVDPFVVLCCQIWRDSKGHHIHFFDEIVINGGDVYKMIERIQLMFSEFELSQMYVTGDQTGSHRHVTQRNNIDAWQMIKTGLLIPKSRLKVPNINPSVEETRHLMNFTLYHHQDFKFSTEMKTTINELLYTEVDSEGKPLKKDRQKDTQRIDCIDNIRYILFSFMGDYIKNYKNY